MQVNKRVLFNLTFITVCPWLILNMKIPTNENKLFYINLLCFQGMIYTSSYWYSFESIIGTALT